ncbi:MAG TPA: AmmeMemoRadiSam system radical SAM enzyme [Syntrophorhabdaceae bacterium]|nr:AmmeMemoRadiSam system radical SAM enzyme [Syntrophorhabdaceae bacterium]HQM81635.1 AmmeMemoRadiSam system radical SAM enzyme [Syntrophorhabdaceae bacterium]
MLTRRDFIKIALLTPAALQLEAKEPALKDAHYLKEALYYRVIDTKKGTVECLLCPRGCTIPHDGSGFCRARKNIKGKLFSLGYASPCAVHIDPIEKKPFFNVYPRSLSFSVASAGCNLRCRFCQNWQISQASPEDTANQHLPTERLVTLAEQNRCRSIAYTYTEPTNFFEYMLDAAKIASGKGILNVCHSNGYINPEPLKALCKYLDAANIDLKGFSRTFYNRLCEAELEPVLETIKILKRSGVWVEITNLVIPGHNDDEKMIADMCRWIYQNAGADTPIHFSRFFPMYRMTSISPTPVSVLEKARDIALKAGLQFAYIGNVPGHPGEHTYCPSCKRMVIRRSGYNILEYMLKGGACPGCGKKVGGIWAA